MKTSETSPENLPANSESELSALLREVQLRLYRTYMRLSVFCETMEEFEFWNKLAAGKASEIGDLTSEEQWNFQTQKYQPYA